MATKQIILFDADSTSPLSQIVCIGPNTCLQVQAFNMGPTDELNVEVVAITPGSIAMDQGGSCCIVPPNAAPSILAIGAFAPCGPQLQINSERNMFVIRAPGCYRLNLTPAAVGTVIAIGTVLFDADACEAAASTCCCEPAVLPPALNLCEQIGALPAGALAVGDTVPVRETGGTCKQVLASDFAGGLVFPILAPNGTCLAPSYSFAASPTSGMWFDPALGPAGAVVISDNNCANRINVGASIDILAPASNVNVTAAGNINVTAAGNAIVTGGPNAILTAISVILQAVAPSGDILLDANDAIAFATNALTRLSILQNGAWELAGNPGAAGQVITSNGAGAPPTWQAAGGGVTFPLLAPNGTCAAPSYSFAASPDSGVWYDPTGVGQVVISDDNCVDQIRVGASITLQTTSTDITIETANTGNINLNTIGGTPGGIFAASGAAISLSASTLGVFNAGSTLTLAGTTGVAINSPGVGANVVVSATGSFRVNTAGGVIERFEITGTGEWEVGGTPGTASQVLTSNGAGVPPTWQSPSGVSFPLLAPNGSCAAPSYSFTTSPDSGMFYDPAGAGTVRIADDNCVDAVTIGGGIVLRTNSVDRATFTSAGEWNVGGSVGTAGQALVSNGAGVAPTWQAVSGTVVEPINQVVYGTGVGVDSSANYTYIPGTGQFAVNNDGAGVIPTSTGVASVRINPMTRTDGAGNPTFIRAGNSTDANSDAGQLHLLGGDTNQAGRRGGDVNITGGIPTGAGSNGANVLIKGGLGLNSGTPGSVYIKGGENSIEFAQVSQVRIGHFPTEGSEGLIVSMLSGLDTSLIGKPGNPNTTRGQNVECSGGNGIAGGNGGELKLNGGLEGAGGTRGFIHFANKSSSTPNLGTLTGFGDWVLAGFGGGTNVTTNTPLPAATTTGFVWLPRIAAAPSAVPSGTTIPGGTGYAFPLCVEPTGVTLKLWMYDFPNAAWRSVLLT